MEYRIGTVGRVITVRFDEGDDFLGGLTEVVQTEQIRCGWFHVLGGLRQGEIVIGPKEPVMPPEPVWQQIAGAREVLGTGSIFWDDDTPKIHLHTALGHLGDTLTGCLRRSTTVYLVLEVVIFEINDIVASRPWYEHGGFNRLTFD